MPSSSRHKPFTLVTPRQGKLNDEYCSDTLTKQQTR